MLKNLYTFLLVCFAATVCAQSNPLVKDPWTKQQLMEPSALVAMLANTKVQKPHIYNIGVVENIQGAKNMGAASEKENLDKFKKAIMGLPKNSTVVIYCGCCPFSRCPNIRPAFKAMQLAGFKNGFLLNIPNNIKTDWINKGYPLEKWLLIN